MLFVIVFGNLFASSCIKYYKITGKYWAEVMHEMIGNYEIMPPIHRNLASIFAGKLLFIYRPRFLVIHERIKNHAIVC